MRQLKKTHDVYLFLQFRGQSLSECRRSLDTLCGAVREFKNTDGHALKGCELEYNYILLQLTDIASKYIVSGTVKIQTGKETSSDSEKEACKVLKKAPGPTISSDICAESSVMDRIKAGTKRKRYEEDNSS